MSREAKLLLAGIFAVGFAVILFFSWLFAPKTAPPQLGRQTTINYNAIRICDNAFEQQLDYSKFDGNNFRLTLFPGCFGGFVRMPAEWKTWWVQPSGNDQNGWWISYWFENEQKGRGIFPPNNPIPHFNNLPDYSPMGSGQDVHKAFRLQGHGQVLFYTNDVIPKAQHKVDGEISVDQTPGLTPPRNIAKVDPSYTDEARKVHFNDTVNVDVIVGEDGFVHDIKFPDPPGYGLEDEIIRALHQWKFRPAQKDGKAVATHAVISVTFHSK